MSIINRQKLFSRQKAGSWWKSEREIIAKRFDCKAIKLQSQTSDKRSQDGCKANLMIAKRLQSHCKAMAKPLQSDSKATAKRWQSHCKAIAKPLQSDSQVTAKRWQSHCKAIAKPLQSDSQVTAKR
jgi:L-rhamnose mutarotase